jgi:replicative DNA helicase Mcm
LTQNNNDDDIILSDNALVDEFADFLGEHAYKDTVASLAFSENPKIVVDYNDIIKYETHELTRHFESNIDNALTCLKQAVSLKMWDTDIEKENKSNNPDGIQVCIKNYDNPIPLRSISTTHTKKMIVVNAIISKTSEEKPFMTKSVYRCKECNNTQESPKNTYIKKCPSCEAEGVMQLDIGLCSFSPFRNIVIQDLPEDLPAGQIPMNKSVRVFGSDLTAADICRPGSRIKLTAIVRLDYDKNTLEDIKANTDVLGILEPQSTGTTFSLILTANNIEALHSEDDSLTSKHQLTKEDIQKIESYKTRQDLNDMLVASSAPHIFGNDYIKECLLLASVGANMSESDIKKRGDINILMVGNAGVAKSQLLLSTAKISPRSVYVSGRGSSGVGLTAAVVKDEKTGTMMLEAGACVLADLGLCIIDEFDKLKPDDRSALHEVMEQQTCSIAKGGIVATLNARVSICAAANPLYGTYDSYKTLAENTGYPPSMISRFDFIFVMKDIVDDTNDTAIAETILADDHHPPVDSLFLAKYVHYIKNKKQDPELTTEARHMIIHHYLTLRRRSEKDKDGSVSAITVTARLVDTLKRVSIARARLLQKERVGKSDVQRVIFLLSKMYESFGIYVPDSETPDLAANVKEIQTINLGLLYGKPASKMNKKKVFFEYCDAITNGGKIDKIDIEQLIVTLVKSGKFVTRYDAEDTIADARRAGVLDQIQGNTYRYNRDMVKNGGSF